jgi:hypothetical protein
MQFKRTLHSLARICSIFNLQRSVGLLFIDCIRFTFLLVHLRHAVRGQRILNIYTVWSCRARLSKRTGALRLVRQVFVPCVPHWTWNQFPTHINLLLWRAYSDVRFYLLLVKLILLRNMNFCNWCYIKFYWAKQDNFGVYFFGNWKILKSSTLNEFVRM